MGKMIFLDSRIFVSGCDLSGFSNEIGVEEEIDDKTTTNFRSNKAVERIGGLSSVSISGGGQFDEGDPSKPGDSFWANRRIAEPWSISPTGVSDTTAGTLMYLTRALRTSIKLFDEVGNVAPWSAEATGTCPLVRGQVAHPAGTARTATGSGTVLDLGAGPTGKQMVYANLHVLSVAGTSTPTLTVTVESATTSGFASPTTRGTFAAATALSGQHMKIATPGTDRYWRVSWTITGGSPSFLFLASLGIE